MIPEINISTLFLGPGKARDKADDEIYRAASDIGFLTITGIPGDCLTLENRKSLLSIFNIRTEQKRKLMRRSFAPENPYIYRGWFGLQEGHATYKEGIDIGPDLVYPTRPIDPTDPLTEHTPVPDLPSWRLAAEAYYIDMSNTAQVLTQSLARGLGLPEDYFNASFEEQISTLRLIHYPIRTNKSFGKDGGKYWIKHNGEHRYLLGADHIDSGFMTLLSQDGVEGLQAKMRNGDWITVPPRDGTLAVNFGKLLARWTGHKIRATSHRVIGHGLVRHSIPFFYEPSINAVISHIPNCGEPFSPVAYGDHLWEETTKFVEQIGVANLRKPRGLQSTKINN